MSLHELIGCTVWPLEAVKVTIDKSGLFYVVGCFDLK